MVPWAKATGARVSSTFGNIETRRTYQQAGAADSRSLLPWAGTNMDEASRMPRILFIASHRPGRSPNQRFRFEQYLDRLRNVGFDCVVSHLVDESDDRILYSKEICAGRWPSCGAASQSDERMWHAWMNSISSSFAARP